MKHYLSGPGAALCLALGLAIAAPAHAAPEVEARVQATSISFSGGQNYTNAVLTVTGPNDYQKEETATRGLPIFRLQTAGRLVDGYYSFSLVAATDEAIPIQSKLDNGRGPDAPKTEYKSFSMYGAFMVEQGLIQPAETEGNGTDGDG